MSCPKQWGFNPCSGFCFVFIEMYRPSRTTNRRRGRIGEMPMMRTFHRSSSTCLCPEKNRSGSWAGAHHWECNGKIKGIQRPIPMTGILHQQMETTCKWDKQWQTSNHPQSSYDPDFDIFPRKCGHTGGFLRSGLGPGVHSKWYPPCPVFSL